MSSNRRILASRANGARSRGPVTPEGKQRSARNGLQHGLAARAIVVKGESPEIFQAYLDQFVARFLPCDEVELSLVEEMAASSWRLRRAWSIEGRLFDSHIDDLSPTSHPERIAAAFSDLAGGPQLALMHRYETRLHMVFQRALSSLLALQQARMQNEPSPNSEHGLTLDISSPEEPSTPAPAPSVEPRATVEFGIEDRNNRNYNEVGKGPPTERGALK